MKINESDTYGIIYIIKNVINNKVYVGQTIRKNGFNGRYRAKGLGIERVYNYYNKEKSRNGSYNKHLLNSIEKYGFNCFQVNELYDKASSREELDEKECYYIKLFNSQNNKYGYNNKDGGNNGKRSSDTRRRDSISKLGWDIETEKDTMKYMYLNELKSYQDIANIYHVSKLCIIDTFKRWNIKSRTRNELGNRNQKGSLNPSARIVVMINTTNNKLYTFNSIDECINWLLHNKVIEKQSDWRHKVNKYIKNKKNYNGYSFTVYSKKEYANYRNAS